MIHNAHVLLWYRWHIWLAKQQGRLFHQTVLIQWHNEELARLEQEVILGNDDARCSGKETDEGLVPECEECLRRTDRSTFPIWKWTAPPSGIPCEKRLPVVLQNPKSAG